MNCKNLIKILACFSTCLLLTSCKTILGDYTSEHTNNEGQKIGNALTLNLNNTCSFSTTTYFDDGSDSTFKEPECTWRRYQNKAYKNLIILTLQNELVEGHVKYYNLIVKDEILVNRENPDIIFYKV